MKFDFTTAFAVLVLGMVALLIVPLPAPLLDALLALNVMGSALVLLLSLRVEEPLQFSAFAPSLLLATLFRLSLEVSATRLILTEGHEPGGVGALIPAFGAFVVRGNIVVGLIIFAILITIQFIVIASGAQRGYYITGVKRPIAEISQNVRHSAGALTLSPRTVREYLALILVNKSIRRLGTFLSVAFGAAGSYAVNRLAAICPFSPNNNSCAVWDDHSDIALLCASIIGVVLIDQLQTKGDAAQSRDYDAAFISAIVDARTERIVEAVKRGDFSDVVPGYEMIKALQERARKR